MAVRYRYPGGEWRSVAGNSFTNEIPEGQCFAGYEIDFTVMVREYYYWHTDRETGVKRDYFYIQYHNDFQHSGKIIVPKPRKVTVLPELYRPFQPYDLNFNNTRGKSYDWYGTREILTYSFDGRKGLRHWYKTDAVRFTDTTRFNKKMFLADSLDVKSYTPLSPEPPNCIKQCVFKVFQDGELTLELKNNVCPEAEIITECPDDTYQFDCGTHLCCHKPDGYAHSRIDL